VGCPDGIATLDQATGKMAQYEGKMTMIVLHKISYDRIKNSFKDCNVCDEYAEPIINYLVYGFNPGAFFTAVIANDFAGAMSRSHPANQVQELKYLVHWMNNCMPRVSWGGYDIFYAWIDASEEYRRKILEDHKLIYTPHEETWEAISKV